MGRVETGPLGGLVDDGRVGVLVTDPATGRIRSILRDWEDVLPATLGLTDSFTVTTVRGLAEAVRLQR